MPRQHLSLAFLALVLTSFSGGLLAQSKGPAEDPVLDPIFKAEDEGRLVDAERLVKAAIQDAEAQPSADRRLHGLLRRLASLDSQMGHIADAIAVAERMIEMDERAPAEADASLALDLNNLGHYYIMAGNEAAAGQTYERELAAARQSGKGLKGSPHG